MEKKKKEKIVVGMSGGVDSSVTAALLRKAGFDVVGVFMKNWSKDVADYGSASARRRVETGCTWAEDSEDARKVASVLDIPFYVWDFEKEYYKKVVEYFLREYKRGRTPNPDVMCNSKIKFDLFLKKALTLGADKIATGHYARIRKIRNRKQETEYKLFKGIDPAKDQSYFLYTLKQKQLSKIMFPIGGYKKTEIRKLAKKFKLPNFAKKDSQGICFIGKINVTDFLKQHIRSKKGDVVSTTGEKLGIHEGLPFYTIGQRAGMGIGGHGPYYVAGKDLRKNKLIVTNDKKDPELWKKEFTLKNLTWVHKQPKFPLKTDVTIRYHHPSSHALTKLKPNARLLVKFRKSKRAITPGQSAVYYRGSELLGGGVISQVY